MKKNINIKYYRNRAFQKRKSVAVFLKKLGRRKNDNLYKNLKSANAAVWKEISCLNCGNCCKTMTPTWKKHEIKRVAAYIGMDYDSYYKKYITVDEDNGDLINKRTPCQHFDGRSNKCQIYEVRPADCKKFPHILRKDFLDQKQVYLDNLHRCPATLLFLEKLETMLFKK
ncbi:MAG: YkgJ family cysteine cluster protein [Chitinophagales bacterium]|nr:YkgJ family cysteine cluster protein [Chitinophagales bacterium]